VFNFDSDKIEEHFAQNAIFEMELALIEFKFDVQALLDADFHFDWSIRIWFSA
jgi:hypothetical protein